MTDHKDQFLWTEKYRPQTIADCILTPALKNTFDSIIAKGNGEIPNMMFSGPPGTGKTTVAMAICRQLNLDYLKINCSESGGIDTLRNEIRQFASTVSFTDGKKVVLLEEADGLTPTAQQGLRAFIEEFANNCRFIFTCNYKNKLIEPLHSRCTVIEFRFSKEDKPAMMQAFLKRMNTVLSQENVTVTEQIILAKFVNKHFPDFRRCLNELQRFSSFGVINESILGTSTDISTNNLYKAMKDKDFGSVRKWVVTNIDADADLLFRKIFDNVATNFTDNSIPVAILILADYQYKAAFVADQEINTVAALTQLMMECQFR